MFNTNAIPDMRGRLRAPRVGTMLTGLCAVSLLLAGASPALAQSQSCPVTFSVTNSTDPLSALQFSSNFAAAPAGGLGVNSCTLEFVSFAGEDANIDNGAGTITFGWADNASLFPGGPDAFVTCDFIATGAGTPTSGNFNPVVLQDASEGTLNPTPANPFPTMSAAVGACANVAAVCGNGVAETGEECDDAGQSATCDDDCTSPVCGDGIFNEDSGEECDDGNTSPDDGCDGGCLLECGNGQLDGDEQCDDGNLVNGDGCSARCSDTADCPATPRALCVTGGAGKSQIKFKDDRKSPASDVKDQGQFLVKKVGAEVADGLIGDPQNGATVYKWCVYDALGLLAGWDIGPDPAAWSCKLDKPGKQQCKYKSKDGNAVGISGVLVKAGAAGKPQAGVKGKSKAGTFASPAMPLVEPVTSQLLVDGGSSLCFGVDFPAPAKKNDGVKGQFQAKGP